MKTWLDVERRLERLRLPYRVERFTLGEPITLVMLDGTPVAVTVQGARDFLAAPGHPDSKRQTRCKQRSLTRYGARVFKTTEVSYTAMLLREEMFIRGRFIASRLLGGRYAG